MAKLEKIITTEAFYDRIAPDYNRNMTAMDAMAREVFKTEVMNHVSVRSAVLDFGGGTGLDLPWESLVFSKIYFLEPSAGMLNIAIGSQTNLTGSAAVVFLHKYLDFKTWDAQHLPCDEKVDMVVADFAVLNCIDNLPLLFDNLKFVCHTGTHVIAMIINTATAAILKNYSAVVALKSLTDPCLKVFNNDRGSGHATYFYKSGFIRSASSRNFQFINLKPVPGSPFAILHLMSK